MSNYGQAALTIVGTVVGTYFGYPQLGFVLGSLAGQTIFPTKLPGQTGPRLADQKTTTATVGAPVAEVIGTDTVAGNIFWQQVPPREVTNSEEVGGKGGPTQTNTSFTYFQSFALGLCRGPKVAVRRIWENGKLVYDSRPQQDGESDAQYAARIVAASTYAEGFTFYPGDEAQMPDPTIELDKGLGEVPAFRGLCFLVFHDRQLQQDQGLRLPAFKVEVSEFGGARRWVYTEDAVWEKPATIEGVEVIAIGGGGGGGGGALPNNSESTGGGGGGGGGRSEATVLAADLPATVAVTVGAGGAGGAEQANVSPPVQRGGNSAANGGASSFGAFVTANGGQGGSGGQVGGDQTGAALGGTGNVGVGAAGGKGGSFGFTTNGSSSDHGGGGGGGGAGRRAYVDHWENDAGGAGGVGGGFDGQGNGGAAGGAVGGLTGGSATAGDDDRAGGGGGGGSANIPNIPRAEGIAGPGGNGAAPGGGGGGGGAGQLQGVNFPLPSPPYDGAALHAGARGGDGARGVVIVQEIGADDEGVSLAEIVTKICARAGVTAAEIDVTDLEADFVTGYTIGRVMSARDALDPLRNVGFFDVIESGEIIVFRKRGGAIDRTLTAEDLGVHEAGGEAPPAVKTRHTDETALPRRMFVHFRNPDRDFEDDEQQSPARSSARTVNDVHLEISIAMNATLAKRCASIIWADAWEAGTTHEIQVDGGQSDLEAGDVLEIPVSGFTERVRVSEGDESLAILRRLLLTRDYDGSYVSVAVADPPERTPGEIVILAPSEILFLDTPALREEDSDAGFYLATRPVDLGATWRGATIYRSDDDGVTFTSIAGTGSEPLTGAVVTALPADGFTDTWDWRYTLRINIRTGSPESRTKAAVLSGANMLAVGAHGRWELVQFLRATQVDDDTFDLNGLLRGRRGTAHLMGTGLAGDTIVNLGGPGILRIAQTTDWRDVERLYKAVTFGMDYASGVDATFTSHGEALRPFSPIDVTVTREETGDWTITWLRRDRLSQTLQGGGLPLSDVPEAYSIDIVRDGSPEVVERTLTSSSESVTYTAAQQADDFGEDTTGVKIRVHQLNPTYGRGPAGELIVGQANQGGLGALDFVADYDDKPLLLGVANGRFLFTRVGKLASTPVVGIYGWVGANPAPIIDTTYDARGQKYVPTSYFAGAIIGSGIGALPPRGITAAQDRWAAYWRINPTPSDAQARELLVTGNAAAQVTIANPAAAPLNVSGKDVVAVRAHTGGYTAMLAPIGIVGGASETVYESSDGGATWALVGDTTGDLPGVTHLDVGEFFEFLGDTYLWLTFGPYKSTEPTMIDWDGTGVTNLLAEFSALFTGGAQGLYRDFAVTADGIVVVMQAGEGDLGAVNRRNLILRSTDGENWTVVRNVLQASDIAPGFAFALEWTTIVPLGTGFAVFGKAKDSAAFPYVLLSTDGGATWGSAQAVDTGDPTSNATINAAISDGTTILAIDTAGVRTMDPSGTFDEDATPVVYGRLSTSTDGLTFTALPGFPVE